MAIFPGEGLMTLEGWIALLVAGAVLCVFVALYRGLRWANEVQQRLARSLVVADAEPRLASQMATRVNQRLGRFSLIARLEQQLTVTQTNLTVVEYLAIQAGCALLGLGAGWLFSGQPIGGLGLAVLGWMAPGFVLRQRQARRVKAFADQMADMLSLLVGSLRAGYGLMHACRVIQQEMPEPMASEFALVLRETMLGYSVNEALDHLVERMNNEDLELVATSIRIQNEVGGSLADVLDTISGTIRERIKIAGEIQAMTAQQRMTGWMMTLLPVALAGVMMLINPDYMMGLFEPGWTLIIPIGSVIMIVIGNIVMRLVVRIEV
jgi:tight adherence protein B